MTGPAAVIWLRRERATVERLIHINATNTAAIDRYNALSDLIARLGGTP